MSEIIVNSNSWRICGDAFDRTPKHMPPVFVDDLKWRWNIFKFTAKKCSSSLTESYHIKSRIFLGFLEHQETYRNFGDF